VYIIKYLILDGTDYKTVSSNTLTTVCSITDTDSVIESAFKTSGMNDLTTINDDIRNQIVSNEFSVVMYKSPK
jgi:hypothetical protein